MIAYNVVYEVNGKQYSKLVEAKDITSAKKKLGRKHGYKSGRMIKVKGYTIVGYF